jgi:hypothetical protein
LNENKAPPSGGAFVVNHTAKLNPVVGSFSPHSAG